MTDFVTYIPLHKNLHLYKYFYTLIYDFTVQKMINHEKAFKKYDHYQVDNQIVTIKNVTIFLIENI